LQIKPTYIVGDFDSIKKEILNRYKKVNKNIKQLIPEKDFTDTEAALEIAIKNKSKTVTIIGAVGTRLDHTIANIHILKYALENNIEVKIINENNEIKLIDKYTELRKDKKYKYISIIPLTTEVTGLTLTGLKYELKNYNLKIGTSLGVSNEQVEDIATINLEKGILILIKSRD